MPEHKQNSTAHHNTDEMGGVELELRELRGLLLRMSFDVERRLNFNALCFGVIISILAGILMKLWAI